MEIIYDYPEGSWDMSIDSFFNVVFDVAIILAVMTFALGFLHLYLGREETER